MVLETLDWVIIAVFFTIVLGIGWYASLSAGKSSSEFFLGGRGMPWWLLGISMVACTFSADTPNLVTGMVREDGVAKNWAWWAFLITGMVTVFIYARLWRRTQLEAWVEEMTSSGQDVQWLWNWGRSSNNGHDREAQEDLPLLVSAVDPSKDQSYFLSGCTSQQLSQVVFPLGDYYKTRKKNSANNNEDDNVPTVRGLAEKWDLSVAHKRDSVGICFIGKRRGGFRSFLQHYYEPSSSTSTYQLVDVETSEVIGTVDALTAQAATIGQGARVSGSPVKYFVVGRSQTDHATILVCAGTHHPALYADSIALATDLSWIMPEIPQPLVKHGELRVQCRIRHLQPVVDATLRYDAANGGEYALFLDRPFRGITPGQRAVLYIHGICLGGATIARASPSYFDLNIPLPLDLHPAGANDLSVKSQQMM